MKNIISDFCQLFLEHYTYLIIDDNNNYLFILNEILNNKNSVIILQIIECLLQLFDIPEVSVICANYFSRNDVKHIFRLLVDHRNRVVTEKTLGVLIRLKE